MMSAGLVLERLPSGEFAWLKPDCKERSVMVDSNVEPGRLLMVRQAELAQLKAELATERKWREDLQAFTIDQAVEIGKLREVLRKIEQATTEALAREVP